jgi:hypothetical protein
MLTENQQLAGTAGTDLEKVLAKYAQTKFSDFSRARFAEEREWYELALFYQRRQWLRWDSNNKRWSLIKKDPQKPKPMPVSNYFAKTINNAANQLGSRLPRMTAVAADESDANRRAAAMAEKSLPAIDQESGMRVLNPLLAKHTALWGIGVTKDYYDRSMGTGMKSVPQWESQQVPMVSCLDCQKSSEVEALPDPNATFPIAAQTINTPCPLCGSNTTLPFVKDQPVVTQVQQFAKGRLVTEVRPIFELYLPRDCQDANLSGEVVHKYRKPQVGGPAHLRRQSQRPPGGRQGRHPRDLSRGSAVPGQLQLHARPDRGSGLDTWNCGRTGTSWTRSCRSG